MNLEDDRRPWLPTICGMTVRQPNRDYLVCSCSTLQQWGPRRNPARSRRPGRSSPPRKPLPAGQGRCVSDSAGGRTAKTCEGAWRRSQSRPAQRSIGDAADDTHLKRSFCVDPLSAGELPDRSLVHLFAGDSVDEDQAQVGIWLECRGRQPGRQFVVRIVRSHVLPKRNFRRQLSPTNLLKP